MAETDFSRCRILPGFKLREVVVPTSGVTVDENGYRSFELQTQKGTIKVEVWWDGLHCRGHKDALRDYGLVSEDCLPGVLGNNKARQIVLFLPDGQIALGKWQGKRPVGYPSLSIARHSSQTFTVTIPFTTDAKEEFDQFSEAWLEANRDRHRMEAEAKLRSRAQKEAAEFAQRDIDRLPNTAGAAREEIRQFTRTSRHLIENRCFEKAYRLSNENEIRLALARLESAIERGKITFDPKVRRAEIDEIRVGAARLYKVDPPPKPALKLVI